MPLCGFLQPDAACYETRTSERRGKGGRAGFAQWGLAAAFLGALTGRHLWGRCPASNLVVLAGVIALPPVACMLRRAWRYACACHLLHLFYTITALHILYQATVQTNRSFATQHAIFLYVSLHKHVCKVTHLPVLRTDGGRGRNCHLRTVYRRLLCAREQLFHTSFCLYSASANLSWVMPVDHRV